MSNASGYFDSLEEQMQAEAAAVAPRYTVSVAARLAAMHPQTLRQYDRLGLVTPARTRGGGRRYSARDIETLCEIQQLSQEEGVNLAGISHIIELKRKIAHLTEANMRLAAAVRAENRIFASGSDGQTVEMERGQRPRKTRSLTTYQASTAVVLWRNSC